MLSNNILVFPKKINQKDSYSMNSVIQYHLLFVYNARGKNLKILFYSPFQIESFLCLPKLIKIVLIVL